LIDGEAYWNRLGCGDGVERRRKNQVYLIFIKAKERQGQKCLFLSFFENTNVFHYSLLGGLIVQSIFPLDITTKNLVQKGYISAPNLYFYLLLIASF